MKKLNAFLIISLIWFLLVPTCILSVSAATGHILVNSSIASAPNPQVQAGGTVNLYFGQVAWSGTQMYLLVSHDASQQVSIGDTVYTPTFSISDLTNSFSSKTYTAATGNWTVGNNWINGTIASNIPVGNYTIKAFDLGSATVAVTDVYVIVYSVVYSSTLQLSPPSGPGGVSVQFTGSGYPPSSPVTISYLDPQLGSWNFLGSATADAQGHISFTSTVPDLRSSVGLGDYPESYSTVSYRAEIQGVVYCYAAYDQYSRGLKRVGNLTASGLYGNGTNLSQTVNVASGDNLTIAGKWFHPGDAIYIRWDGKSVVGTVTGNQWLNAQIIGNSIADSQGYFMATAAIPVADAGSHYISAEDSQTKLIITVSVSTASLYVSPASGPGGVSANFTGSRYPPSAPVTISYLDPTFGTWNTLNSTISDSQGRIFLTVNIPDLQKSVTSYDTTQTGNPISFRSESGGVIYCTVNYNQYARGLKRVGNQIATGLYGNGTNFASTVQVAVGDSITVSGQWFHPGDAIYIRWDGKSVVGTVTGNQWLNAQIIGTSIADSQGFFTTTATVPIADAGAHYLSVEDSQTKVIVQVGVVPSNGTAPPKAPSTINMACNSTTSYLGYEVSISGKLTSNQITLSGQPILLSYSLDGGASWLNLTLVYTAPDGTFSATWMPQVSGTYLIMASYSGNSAYNGTSQTVTLASTPYLNQNVFSVISNSTVTAFSFNSATNQLTFVVSGPSGTTGFVDVELAKSLVSNISTVQVLVDNVSENYSITSTSDSWLLHFTYSHSTHIVNINLESSPLPTTSSSPTLSPNPTNPPFTSNSPTDTPTSAPTQTPIAAQTLEPSPIITPAPSPSSTPAIPEFLSATVLVAVVTAASVTLIIAKKKLITRQKKAA